MSVVLASSVAASWAPGDEAQSDTAAAAMSRIMRKALIVPAIFWYALRNVLIRSERRGRIALPEVEAFLRQLSSYSLRMDFTHDEGMTLALARRHVLSFYDAASLETAMRLGADLATLDDALGAAARIEGVPNPAG